jgi:hypothetical protein
VISRMQRRAYQDRLKQAAELLEPPSSAAAAAA